jgi:glycosyltransferase involved in cell wall biosynthesis
MTVGSFPPSAGPEAWPRVTVVTPSYNQGRYLEETIRSVLEQDYPNVEYIVVDGGSTDESVEIIQKYSARLAHWVSEPDRGQADAINKGFRLATGDFLAWLNSDDCYDPGFIRGMVQLFRDRPGVDLIYRDVRQGTSPNDTAPRYGQAITYSDMVRTVNVPIPQMAAMWRRSIVDRVGFLDPKWRVVLDREYFLRIGLHGTMEYVPGIVGFFRHHADSKSIAEEPYWIREIPALYTEFFARTDLPTNIAALRRETMSAAYTYCAKIARRHGNSFVAAGLVAKAIAIYPRAVGKLTRWGPRQLLAEATGFFRRSQT